MAEKTIEAQETGQNEANQVENGNIEPKLTQGQSKPEDVQNEPENGQNGDGEKKAKRAKRAATGIREAAGSKSEVQKAEKKESEDKDFEYPAVFVDTKKRLRLGVDILFDPENGRVMLMVANNDGQQKETELKYLRRIHEWADFTHPTYNDMVSYRETSMTFDKDTNRFLADPVKLRLHYLRFHLKAWSLKDNEGNPVELIQEGSMLNDKSMEKVGTVTPSLIDIFLTEFERLTMLG